MVQEASQIKYVERRGCDQGGGSEGERPVGGRVLGSVHDGLLIKPVFLNTLESEPAWACGAESCSAWTVGSTYIMIRT